MQKYQVFIDEHLVSFTEGIKSNQQLPTVFRLINPSAEDMNCIVKWLIKEKKIRVEVQLISEDTKQLWKIFQANLQLIEAAGGLVRNSQQQVLLIYRLGKWDLPKGKMEKGETPEQAAVREVEEECGISGLSIKKPLAPTFHIYQQKQKLILKQTYWFEMYYTDNEDLIPQTEESIEKAIWATSAETGKYKENTYASLTPLFNQIVTG